MTETINARTVNAIRRMADKNAAGPAFTCRGADGYELVIDWSKAERVVLLRGNTKVAEVHMVTEGVWVVARPIRQQPQRCAPT
jgi:hypothetical protein